MQQRTEEAEAVKKEFEKAWKRADSTLKKICTC